MQAIDHASVNTLRFLAADQVEKAKSGHPGFPLGTAPLMYTLWDRFMRYNPKDPNWFNRDRFVLSPGHGSALLYAMLHLAGYDVSMEELKNFRQWGSKTPGHPEYGHTAGVDASTGPLGHGFAMGVGFAVAEAMLAAKYNKPEFTVIDHYTYGLTSDGDLMEGVASEAASLAGTLGLGKLIYLYDDNKITIEGSTDIAFTEDVEARFKAYGWQVLRVADSEDIEAMEAAVKEAQADIEHPSLIIVRTHIGYGSPKQDSASCHGEPLGAEALALTKEKAGWPVGQPFYVPLTVSQYFKNKIEDCEGDQKAWEALMADYKVVYPELGTELEERISGNALVNLHDLEAIFKDVAKTATREASGDILQKLVMQLPNLVGGSADLGPSNKTVMKNVGYFSKTDRSGRNIHFGVREHAMGTVLNGIALHGGFIPFGGTFLVFADFMRPAIRMAALMGLRSIFVLTHDSIALGEDGPTHQPIEHLAMLRSLPNYMVFRPCDTRETAAGWYAALTHTTTPTGLILSRQNMPALEGTGKDALKGAYILRDCEGTPDVLLMASGSEVELIYKAYDELAAKGVKARVISMPCWELFAEQSDEYKESVMPKAVRARLAVEAAADFGWHKFVGLDGDVICMEGFGASAPAGTLFKDFGFTVEQVVERAMALVK